jgi:thiol-disulfide isomerase/thioredoxin
MVRLVLSGLVLSALLFIQAAKISAAQQPSAADALRLKPIQADVDYDIPDAEAVKKCSIQVVKFQGGSGWHVKNEDGQLLRRFLDSNGDGSLDLWCYYKDGIEVYRDIDGDFDKNADQCRWLGTAGTRWAEDRNQDGEIDRWKVISPEEVTAEVVAAISNSDAGRFRRVLLTPEELKSLDLGEKQTKRLAERVAATAKALPTVLRDKKLVGQDAKWVNFGGTRPGIVPAGTDGSTSDLEVYENVAAVVQNGDDHSQIVIGTLVRVDRGWRVIDVPRNLSDDQVSMASGGASDGFFFNAILSRPEGTTSGTTGGLSPKLQELVRRLERIDADLAAAKQPETLSQLNAERADVLEELASIAENDEDEATWLRQLADTTSAAAQSGGYPDGVKRLEAVVKRLAKDKKPVELVAYVKFQALKAGYYQSLQSPGGDEDFLTIQGKWLEDLKQFVEDFAGTNEAADAIMQLAIAEEFAGKDTSALDWYTKVVNNYADTNFAKQAEGAQRRLELAGKTLKLTGTDINGKPFSIDSLRGKVVIVHFWATWCKPFLRNDRLVLEAMLSRYGKDNVALVGVNVDAERETLDKFLADETLPWTQLFAPGGMDSPLARQFGILTLPTMFLVDQQGKVVSRNLQAGEVDVELRKLVK